MIYGEMGLGRIELPTHGLGILPIVYKPVYQCLFRA